MNLIKKIFNFKSNFYFLQKLVFALFCFLLGFLLGSGMLKAKAADENILDYTQQYDDFKELDFTNIYKIDSEIKYESFKNELDDVISELDQLNVHYLIVFEHMHKKSDYIKGGFTSQMRIFIFNNNISTVPFSLKKSGIYISTSDSWSSASVRANIYTFKYGSKFVTSLENFSNYLNNNNQLPGTKGGYLQDDLSSIYYSTSDPFAPYYGFYGSTNEFCYLYHYNNINITASMSGFDGIKIGDTILKNEMPVYTELEDYGKPVEVYTENYQFNTKNIKQVEYTFDLKDNENPIHEFNFSVSWNYGNSSFDEFDYPYLQYKKNGVYYELPLNEKKSESLGSLIYSDSQINSFQNIEELKFIVPVEKTSTYDNSNMLIHFDSSLNYTRKIYTKDEDIPIPIPGGLKLKNSFNSGTNAYGLGKITWNLNVSDNSLKDGKSYFKLQFGSNDFTKNNIPVFNRYKIYGKNVNDAEWLEINNNQIYIDKINYLYDNSETILTGLLHVPIDKCIYEQLQIEFYFDNTINFYMHVYDDLIEENNWNWYEKFLENYLYYEFPKDKKYAFISHKQNYENSSKIYVPYNFTINDNILFSSYIYDFSKKVVTKRLSSLEYNEDNYYSYYDFNFSFKNQEILMLQRKKSNEKAYFYIHKDFIVTFSDSINVSILTPDGFININPDDIDNPYDNEKNKSIFQIFNNLVNKDNPFFKTINQIWNEFSKSKIYNYIILLIAGTLIVILINALNRG